MRWQGRRRSQNIDDRRRAGASGGARAGGIGGLGLVVVILLALVFDVDVSQLVGGQDVSSGQQTQITAEDERAAEFVSVVLADTETIWEEVFRTQIGAAYQPPTLVLFKGATRSACGLGQAATGPFYCPTDKQAYLDTDFFVTMERRLGAGGDFAQAYVIAHEVAHHVQNELGILGQANRIRAQVSQAESNAISVRIELQADCYSGIWARYAQERLGTLERGDLQEALNAARQIGDDTLQRNAGQRVQPHTFTHGTSQQRQRWFARGYETGQVAECDTFSAARL